MILQSLDHLYDRLVADRDYAVAPPGYSLQNVGFAVVLHPDGTLHGIEDRRETDGKRAVPIQMLVPGQAKPSGSGINPCFLWDNPFYLFGYPGDEADARRAERANQACAAFRDRHLSAEHEIADPAFSAVCRFLESWSPDRLAEHPEITELAGFGVFQLLGQAEYVHQRPLVRSWWAAQSGAQAGTHGVCLVTGKVGPIANIHEPKLKGIAGAQSAGALLVSFNCEAFTSYGKSQSFNAPVSKEATFRYATALNAILSGPRSSRHRLRVGDTTVVFWTEEPTVTEGWLQQLLTGEVHNAQDDAQLEQIRVLIKALRNGGGELSVLGDDPATPVHVLGLAPNAGRLSVRFWHTDSLGALFDRLKSHHDALRIVRQFGADSKRPDPEFPSFQLLLDQTARDRKDTPPLLGGALMRAVLEGTPYPDALANAVMRRIRADHNVNYPRAAIFKAWLTRKPFREGGVTVSLDVERESTAYRLGRLFAVLEKAQEEAQPGINATIRDRFYSTASATPSVAFPRLLRTYQHHLAKLDLPLKVARERLVQEIVDGVDEIPSHFDLESQAEFAIGYYHQRKSLFTRAVDETETEE